MSYLRNITTLVLLGGLANSAVADWQLDGEASTIGFSSVKNGSIVEAHKFGSLAGQVSASGSASVNIELASVDTMIPIRDERMREMLFNVASFPSATFSTTVPVSEMSGMAVGDSQPMTLAGELSLHGKTAEKRVDVVVSRTGEGRFVVATERPVMVSAGEFGLDAGLGRLQEIAGLQSISPMVPVSFTLLFEEQVAE